MAREDTGFLIAAYGSAFRLVIECVEDQDNVITNEALDRQFGPMGAEPVEDVQEKQRPGSRCTSGVDRKSKLRYLRRLVRRRDPLSGGKRRALLRQLLVPDRCKLQDLPAGLEKWEELVRRYGRSKSSGTTATALGDDSKTAALEALVRGELEQHLAMNRARLITYEQVRSEIQAYIGARRSQSPGNRRCV